ncbi:MAG: ComF family protein [Chloroflexota bacterium]|nr:ComF family protein [Chloroflexota bacterium]
MALQTKLARMPELLLDLIFPRKCVGCGMEGEFLCVSCAETLPRLELPFCDRCGIPITQGHLCHKCLKSPFVIDGIRSLFLHEGLARDAVHSLKYNNLKALGPTLAKFMAEFLEFGNLSFDLLAAVPMHSKRMRKRGYNQADLLVDELSRLVRLPVARGTLVRLRDTPSQVSLGAEDRRHNMQGAFRCYDSLQDRKVLLVDDVCTTGATLNACAVALKEAGAASVWGLTLSREC